jgi:hypothetical protein
VAPLSLVTSGTAPAHQLPHQLPPAPPLSAYQHQPHQHHPQQPVENGERLACFDRGPSTQLRVNWSSFNGYPYLSLRLVVPAAPMAVGCRMGAGGAAVKLQGSKASGMRCSRP